MKVVLSSNPYRDRGLRSAQEAKRILEHENIETVMCLPFTPRKGEKVEIPHGVVVSTLESIRILPVNFELFHYEMEVTC